MRKGLKVPDVPIEGMVDRCSLLTLAPQHYERTDLWDTTQSNRLLVPRTISWCAVGAVLNVQCQLALASHPSQHCVGEISEPITSLKA
jgi:hypothetical protein